jgi:uncharacterized membrane protein YfcA
MLMSIGTRGLLLVFALVATSFALAWWLLERGRSGRPRRTTASDVVIGFGTNFFDALGIGSFATTSVIFKLTRRMPDEDIPGTLNVGHALPVLVEAAIFTIAVAVDFGTLITMLVAAVLGAWCGAGWVARLPRRVIQLGMGVALFLAAMLFLAANLGWIPGGGTATGLQGGTLVLAACINFALGALNTLGVGLYAPCLILVSLLGMNPLTAFPIMMGSCALLMPAASARFIRAARYNRAAAVGLTVGGIPGVLIAAYLVKSLPLFWLRWLVVVVVLYTSFMMLRSGHVTPLRVARKRVTSDLR